ncbi:threonine-phosphate decarboxylase [Lusitaniella coriacea LEGE 07157]|uniref:threonine-phosphate decarboxylase n=1 Tax=Lusitaniella coriacea LEGE 07157 TaxID=945747 RepID=A0A8J7B326_9CYAN|nr:threonine-phosphate decarboxylase CobD [Lusitaniella coriacea]MBE9114752.1 threonine-phosphate decarboxylase [Lusitaniella coriacea LEGE 07157]
MNRPIHGGNLAWASAWAGCSPEAILDFSASINPLGPPQSAIAAIERGLEALRAYPDPDYSRLRAALAAVHGIDPKWVLPGNGSAELLTWAGWEFSQQESTALVIPAFSDYGRALGVFGAKVVDYPLSLPHCPLPAFVTGRGRGLLLNNPHNPTGQLWTRAEILPYLAEFELVVVDEAFMDFLPRDRAQSLVEVVGEYPNLVVLRSLTKFYSLPGLRLGYAIAHPDRLQRWQQWRDPWPVNVLAAFAGEAVVGDREFVRQTLKWLEGAKRELHQGLRDIAGLYPLEGAANYLLVRTEGSSSQLQQKLLQNHRILIRDCLSFPELRDRYFRIAVRTPSENQRLLDALASEV